MVRYAIRKAAKIRIASILLVIQMGLSLVLLVSAFSLNSGYSLDADMLYDLYQETSFCYLRDLSDQDHFLAVTAKEADVVDRQKELYRWMKDNEDFLLLSLQQCELTVYRDFAGAGDVVAYDTGGDTLQIKGFRADRDFFEHFPLRIAQGRAFLPEDFIRADEMPVVLGAAYQAVYALGDVIPMPGHASSLRVIGFLEPQAYVAFPRSAQRAFVGDAYVIYPFLEPDEASGFTDLEMLLFQSVIIPFDEQNMAARIPEKSRELGLYTLSTTAVAQPVFEQAEAARKNQVISWLSALVVLVFTGFNAFYTLLHLFRLRQPDYRTMLKLGGSPARVAALFFIEALTLALASALVALIASRIFSVSVAGILPGYVLFFSAPIYLLVYLYQRFALRSLAA